MIADVRAAVAPLAATLVQTSSDNLIAGGASTPDNAIKQAADAFAAAFGFGISSAVVTAAFEAVFPEKLNTLNGAGPMLAQMAGFKEVAQQVLEPLYANAFGRSLEYKYRSIFKPELPDESDAVTWHARRLLTDDAAPNDLRFLRPEVGIRNAVHRKRISRRATTRAGDHVSGRGIRPRPDSGHASVRRTPRKRRSAHAPGLRAVIGQERSPAIRFRRHHRRRTRHAHASRSRFGAERSPILGAKRSIG